MFSSFLLLYFILIFMKSLIIACELKHMPNILPVMFCKNKRGIFRWQQSCIKWVPFNADSENKTPLLPIIPTGMPITLENPHTKVSPYIFLNSSNLTEQNIKKLHECENLKFYVRHSTCQHCFFNRVATQNFVNFLPDFYLLLGTHLLLNTHF